MILRLASVERNTIIHTMSSFMGSNPIGVDSCFYWNVFGKLLLQCFKTYRQYPGITDIPLLSFTSDSSVHIARKSVAV